MSKIPNDYWDNTTINKHRSVRANESPDIPAAHLALHLFNPTHLQGLPHGPHRVSTPTSRSPAPPNPILHESHQSNQAPNRPVTPSHCPLSVPTCLPLHTPLPPPPPPPNLPHSPSSSSSYPPSPPPPPPPPPLLIQLSWRINQSIRQNTGLTGEQNILH